MNEKLREIANRHLVIRYDEDSQMEEFSNDALIVMNDLLKDTIKECINVLRQEWYNENNTVIDDKNLREVNIHYGHKKGLIQAINKIEKLFGVK